MSAMATAMAALPTFESFCELSELRVGVRDSARRSLRFLAQRVMGLRLSDERCELLERGALPKDNGEARALDIFRQLQRGSSEPAGLNDLERFLLSEL